MSSFSIGDRVRVKANLPDVNQTWKGRQGTVVALPDALPDSPSVQPPVPAVQVLFDPIRYLPPAQELIPVSWLETAN